MELSAIAQKNVQKWLTENYDTQSKELIKNLLQNNIKELEDCFYKNLEFGTGGIRGLMGVGTNRMNIYTIGFVTQGFVNYLKKAFPNQTIKIALAYDSRNNSQLFAETAAKVFAANDCSVYLFKNLRPTPELSFAIRELNCHAGAVCTASHNPKEYNGYKVYWNDGAQVIEPHDENILKEINQIKTVEEILWSGNEKNIHLIEKEIDDLYIKMVVDDLCLNKDVIKHQANLKIVYTPIHGTGITLVPEILKKLGFNNVHIVQEQATPDGNFPTVVYPNPEETEAMQMGLNYAKKIDADILLGTDPDADRVSIGIKNKDGEWMLLNGNQTALLVFTYCIESFKKTNSLNNTFIAKTIVTTDLIDVMAKTNGISCYNVLTGFKWIASMIAEKKGKEKFLVGGEESFGLLIGDKVRDKDAISAVAVICEMLAFYKNKNLSLFEALNQIYQKYGFYFEGLVSVTKKGKDGKQEIETLLNNFRNNVPKTIIDIPLVQSLDYLSQISKNHMTNTEEKILLPKSNVLQFILADHSKISFRPSGTEPKIKYYISVTLPKSENFNYQLAQHQAQEKINKIINALNLKN